MPYIIARGRWYHIIVLNVHAPTEGKIDDVKHSFHEELVHVFDKFPKYRMKILLGDFIAKVGKLGLFKTTNENQILHKTNNDNGVRLVNLPRLKIKQSKSQCSHFAASINIFGRLHRRKPSMKLTIFR
jgi:hypothetical protein